ncbi:ribosomal protein L7/L12 [Streptomyces sp. NPDC050211]|uniref:ribosomal protein L7/L12 n=1 Tax=Streptomyces sp. NPDC050211 TaxID=3154932 RepID=UPI00343EC48C
MDMTVLLFSLLAIVALWGTVEARVRRIDRRAAHLERKVDLLLEHLGVQDAGPAELSEVEVLLRKGKKIQAIKLYREITGADLVEAKAAVERLEA